MTVDQYLRKASREAGISGLLRSLYSSKIMSFSEWDAAAEKLVGKKVK
jgi:hypothetical protein